ncbi:MAG: type II secretion system F family protein [Alphaproteobacteria bacterium]|nr:type II secretion system F family protein [Alphaproteobacteria bacterium]
MMDVLTSPILWIGLGALLALVYFSSGSGMSGKKKAARLARVTRKNAPMLRAGTASLRRLNPGEDTSLGQMLASMQSIAKLRARLEVAGLTQTTPQQFLLIMGGITLGMTLVLLLLGKPLLVSLPIGLLFGLAIPHLVVGRKIKKRQKMFLKLFPDAIDLMVRGLRAGLPVAESFINVSKELPPPMGDTFGTIAQQTQLGMPMEKALAENATKLGLTEFNFFVTTIILQRETGGNLGEILNNLSEMLRQRHMMRLKIGALSSEARASAYIIGALPFLVFGILMAVSPDYLQPLFNDARGNKALIGAMASLGMGAFIMKRMTQLEI